MARPFAFCILLGTLLVASVASTASAARLVEHFHGTFSDTFADTLCGIDGTSVVSGMENVQVSADDTFKQEFRLNQTFTSAATGKSILFFVAQQFKSVGPPIDNGDGTITFVSTFKGLAQKVKLPNGRVLVRDAGFAQFNSTFDATTDEFLGETHTPVHGPHPILDSDGAAFCDAVIPALS
jgi:hypothetical protein